MSSRRLVPLLACAAAGKLALDHICDSDLFWQLRLGLDVLAQHRLPLSVDYSWSVPGAARAPADWAAQLVLAVAFRLGGFPAVGLLKAALAVLLGVLVSRAVSRRAGENVRAAALALALAIVTASTQLFARPLLFAAVLLAGLVLLLDRVAHGHPREALLLPPLFVAWVNVYGNWPLGFGVVAVALAEAFLPAAWGRLRSGGVPPGGRRWLGAGAALSLPAVLVNPGGLALVERPFWLVRHRALLSVFDEWAPVPWTSPGLWALLVTATLLGVTVALGRTPLSPWRFALAGGLFCMALGAAKQHLPFAIVTAPLLAEQLAGWIPPLAFLPARRLNAAVALVACLLLGGVGLTRLLSWRHDLRASAPVAAVDALLASPLGLERGFASFDWGGYLVFRRIPTFVDGRLEPFLDDGIFERYLNVEQSGDAAWLEDHGVRWLLERPGTPLARAVRNRPGWRLAYQDSTSVLWVRG